MKAILVFSAVLLAACASPPKHDELTYGASVGIVNHTEHYIDSASVNGAGGANMSAWGAGSASVCCASVPRKWYPGMKADVRWRMPARGKQSDQERTVEVEPYTEGGSIYIHIFPNDEVRVVVSRYAGWSPKHPIPPPVEIARPLDEYK